MVVARWAIGHAGPQFVAGTLVDRGGGRAVAVDGGTDGVDIGDAGLGEAGEVVTASIDLELEVAGPPTDPERELGRDAPAECSKRSRSASQVARTAGPEPLDVAVLVAGRRTDVVGGDDAAQAVADAAAGSAPRPAATARRRRELTGGRRSCVEDVIEGVGVDRRRQAVADARGPDRDPSFGAPGVRRQVVGQLGDEQDGVVGADRRRCSPVRAAMAARSRRQPSSGACGSQSKVSIAPASSTVRVPGGRNQQRLEERRLASEPRQGAGHERDTPFDQDP